MNVREALILQLQRAMANFNLYSSHEQFKGMTTTELDYATEVLRTWDRVCHQIPTAISSCKYWTSLYVDARFNSESLGNGHLDADASAELSWSESVLGGSEGTLEES